MSTAETFAFSKDDTVHAENDDYRSLSRSAVFGVVLGVLGLSAILFPPRSFCQ